MNEKGKLKYFKFEGEFVELEVEFVVVVVEVGEFVGDEGVVGDV